MDDEKLDGGLSALTEVLGVKMTVCPVCGDKRCVHALNREAPCAKADIYTHNSWVANNLGSTEDAERYLTLRFLGVEFSDFIGEKTYRVCESSLDEAVDYVRSQIANSTNAENNKKQWIFQTPINSLVCAPNRRVVCAAVRVNAHIICSARHYDSLMHAQMNLIDEAYSGANVEQGFIDQHGEFMTREEAHKVATEAGQIIRRCGGDVGRLFSENLY
ncbi:MAG: hypothetical protein WAO76_00425 [Georgfuchsia sp.]